MWMLSALGQSCHTWPDLTLERGYLSTPTGILSKSGHTERNPSGQHSSSLITHTADTCHTTQISGLQAPPLLVLAETDTVNRIWKGSALSKGSVTATLLYRPAEGTVSHCLGQPNQDLSSLQDKTLTQKAWVVTITPAINRDQVPSMHLTL